MAEPAVRSTVALAAPEALGGASPARSARDLLEIVAVPAHQTPTEEALRFLRYPPGAAPVAEPVRWGELWRGALAFAARLHAAGTVPGDRVLVALPTGREWLEAFFGALAAGALPVPVSPPMSLRGRRFEAQLETLQVVARDCGARAAALLPRPRESVAESLAAAELGVELLALEGRAPAAGTAATPAAPWPVEPTARPNPDATAVLQYTSGSTSRPKGVMLSHRAILANVRAITEVLFHEEARAVSWLPLYHDMGLIGTLLTPLFARVPLALMSPADFVKDPRRWLCATSDFDATVTAAPNFAFNYCCESIVPAQLDGVRLDGLFAILDGAEPVDPVAVRRFEDRFAPLGLRRGVVRPVYGLAESALAVTFAGADGLRVDRVDADRLECGGEAVPARGGRSREVVSVGRPVDGQQVRVADPRDRPLPERRVGQVLVRGESVMLGYFRRRRASAAALAGGWLHTGDIGYLAGGELYLVGRQSELIFRYGRNVHPEDMEIRVGRIPGVHPGGVAAFVARDAGEGGEPRVVVVVETRLRYDGERAALAREIRDRLQAAFEFGPDEVALVPPGAIPRTTSGKVQRRRCRRMFAEGGWRGRRETT